MQRFLDGALDVKRVEAMEDRNTSTKSENHSRPMSGESLAAGNDDKDEVEKSLHYLSNKIDSVIHIFIEKGEFPSGVQLPKASSLANGSEDLLYSSNIAFQIAASIKRAQSCDKVGNDSNPSIVCEKENELSPKIIAEKLVASLDPTVNGLSIRACNGHINFYASNPVLIQKNLLCTEDISSKYIMINHKMSQRTHIACFWLILHYYKFFPMVIAQFLLVVLALSINNI
ncbi:hypothetical protein V8G54_021046 [Vigna mungo]|uniref:Arginyl tRNA synthetase N-terminal domain-containing protein n=1 Tax=Vigna mungo TaxID=3915 RepID=A0AAQ3ND90_VIGMU